MASQTVGSLKISDFAQYRDRRLELVSGDSVKRELDLLSSVLETARREWGVSNDNPVRLVRRPKGKPGRQRRVTQAECDLIMRHSDSPVVQGAVILALETGMRRGEIAGLRWEHVDLKTRVLAIPMTKNGEPRRIPLSNAAAQSLATAVRRIDGHVFGVTPESLSQAFERARDRALSAFEADRYANLANEESKFLRDLRFHDLRHEATSRLFEKGLNVMEVATITDHKTLQMLKRYTHLRPEAILAKLG